MEGQRASQKDSGPRGICFPGPDWLYTHWAWASNPRDDLIPRVVTRSYEYNSKAIFPSAIEVDISGAPDPNLDLPFPLKTMVETRNAANIHLHRQRGSAASSKIVPTSSEDFKAYRC